jgi:hypothetical protein
VIITLLRIVCGVQHTATYSEPGSVSSYRTHHSTTQCRRPQHRGRFLTGEGQRRVPTLGFSPAKNQRQNKQNPNISAVRVGKYHFKVGTRTVSRIARDATGVMCHVPAIRRSAYSSAYLCITVLLLVTAMVFQTIAFRSARSAWANAMITGTVRVSASMASVLWPSLSAHSLGSLPVALHQANDKSPVFVKQPRWINAG